MNGTSYDPGLRHAFTQQTYQRLISESNQARMAKSVITEDSPPSVKKQFTLRMKVRIIAQVIHEADSTIVTILKASSYPANA
jgi:hypothetical protein